VLPGDYQPVTFISEHSGGGTVSTALGDYGILHPLQKAYWIGLFKPRDPDFPPGIIIRSCSRLEKSDLENPHILPIPPYDPNNPVPGLPIPLDSSSGGGDMCPLPVPGPLPVIGVFTALGWSIKIRKRIRDSISNQISA
jgi:hypothetical protein